MGILVGLLVYVTQRDKSRFAAFQGLQAAVYQLFVMGASIVLWMCYALCSLATSIPLMADPDAYDTPPTFFWVGFGSMVIPLGLMLLAALYGLFAALRVWRGADFRYIGVGPWLQRSGLWNGDAK
jgi:uncharacterized Tic20 family protein